MNGGGGGGGGWLTRTIASATVCMVGVKMAETAPPRAKKAKKSAYSLFLLNFCNSFHEFNFEMEVF